MREGRAILICIVYQYICSLCIGMILRYDLAAISLLSLTKTPTMNLILKLIFQWERYQITQENVHLSRISALKINMLST